MSNSYSSTSNKTNIKASVRIAGVSRYNNGLIQTNRKLFDFLFKPLGYRVRLALTFYSD